MDSKNRSYYEQGGAMHLIEIIRYWPSMLFNAAKYCGRAGRKPEADPVEDMNKALRYLDEFRKDHYDEIHWVCSKRVPEERFNECCDWLSLSMDPTDHQRKRVLVLLKELAEHPFSERVFQSAQDEMARLVELVI